MTRGRRWLSQPALQEHRRRFSDCETRSQAVRKGREQCYDGSALAIFKWNRVYLESSSVLDSTFEPTSFIADYADRNRIQLGEP